MLGGLELLRDCHFVQDGLEKSDEAFVRTAKVLLSSCSLTSSVANESARDVFERTVKAGASDKEIVRSLSYSEQQCSSHAMARTILVW